MKYLQTFALLFILLLLSWYSCNYQLFHLGNAVSDDEIEFDTSKALAHVKNISTAPHFVGSTSHQNVISYILNELQQLNLQPEIQQGYTVSKNGTLSYSKNIVARIPGKKNSKSLVLLSHYDSNPHSSYGASDNATGVATILEGLRSYLHKNTIPNNDIIILFTDGEELGLNGALLFAEKHRWAKDIGLVLNFEARGSGGPSFMLVETNGKNARLLKAFSEANVPYPVANSLAYSVYKIMPNDTDLTVFKEVLNVDGFNFAFIDDHFDYHTANDQWQRLDLESLQHQGSYISALAPYFAKVSLRNLTSDRDLIYFNIPLFGVCYYPFYLRYLLLGFAFLGFFTLLILGIKNKRLTWSGLLKSILFTILYLAVITYGSVLLWNLLQTIHPQYAEIQQGFSYNGHTYILAFVLLAIGTMLLFQQWSIKYVSLEHLYVSYLFVWLSLSVLAAIYIPGASYSVLPVLFGLGVLLIRFYAKKQLLVVALFATLPVLFLFVPFVRDFPIALGLKMLFLTTLLTTLILGLCLPVIQYYTHKNQMGILFILAAICCLGYAGAKSSFTADRRKPNSLVYLLDKTTNQSSWNTYDKMLDSWNERYFDVSKRENVGITKSDTATIQFYSKYGSTFTHSAPAPIIPIPKSDIRVVKDTIIDTFRNVTLLITPKRQLQRLDLFTDTLFNFQKLQANGSTTKDFVYKNGITYNAFSKRWDKRLLTYYIVANAPLMLEMQFLANQPFPKLIFFESSFDLLTSELVQVPERTTEMMPKPFVLNDAITVKHIFKL